jgi:phosphoribosyl-dephospho-CoA transferase
MTAERHHLIYLNPQAELSIASMHANKKVIEQQVKAWLVKGLPCIYTKQLTPSVPAHVHLGLPLLYDNKKHRVSLRVMLSAVQKHQQLPQLMEMQDFFAHYYRIELSNIVLLESISDLAVYGSFLFHYLSGQNYVNEVSDLDLLFNYQGYSLAFLDELTQVLTKEFKRTIDGEIRFPLFGDIPLKELLNLSAKKLLCKRKDHVTLVPRTELYEHYPLL